jgi:hypothetical protein
VNESRRRSILDAASKDPELIAQLPAVVAAGFGILALRRLGDLLTVACFPQANKQAIRLLRDVLEVEIVATPFEEGPLHEAIRAAYFSEDESVNFPTFEVADFLDDPASAAILRDEKIESPEPRLCELPADQLVLATLTYRSVLTNTDAPSRGQALPQPQRTRMALGEIEGTWRIEDDGLPHLYSAKSPPPDSASAVLTEYRFNDLKHLYAGAVVSEHQIRTRYLEDQALVIHPTEIQLTGVERDGTLRLHVYDHLVRMPPGRPESVQVLYHFLSYGNRMRRLIQVDVHEIVCVPRASLRCHVGAVEWKASDLGRWFGLPEDGLGVEE